MLMMREGETRRMFISPSLNTVARIIIETAAVITLKIKIHRTKLVDFSRNSLRLFTLPEPVYKLYDEAPAAATATTGLWWEECLSVSHWHLIVIFHVWKRWRQRRQQWWWWWRNTPGWQAHTQTRTEPAAWGSSWTKNTIASATTTKAKTITTTIATAVTNSCVSSKITVYLKWF